MRSSNFLKKKARKKKKKRPTSSFKEYRKTEAAEKKRAIERMLGSGTSVSGAKDRLRPDRLSR